ncbi:MAG: thioesterase superfamily protein [Firmicutes bacterium]|nr:thioesterase superfamily protein [Bacillota bacterium]
MRKLNPAHIEIMKGAITNAPFMRLIGMKTTVLDYGICTIEVELEHKHIHAYGAIHGAVYAAMIDTVAYWACYCHMEEDATFLSADLNVSDLASVKEGKLTAEGRAIKIGRSLCLAEATVKDETGRLLAHGTSKMIVAPNLLTAAEGIKSQGIDYLPPKFLDEEG